MAELMNDDLRILLLEDVPLDAELINRELRKANIQFTSRCVQTKADFLRELREFTPAAIICDFSLGQFNALDALELMKVEAPGLPFVLVTGSQSEEVAVACIKRGADDYILKSSLKRLPSALISALQRKEAERNQMRAEAALRRSEEHFRSLIENSSDIITIISGDGTITYQSPSVERVLGYSPAELVGRNVFEYIHPADGSFVQYALNDAEYNRSLEYRFRHKDGSWRVLETIGKNLLSDPEVAGLIVNSRDVTERKQAEERIREQAALLDKAQDAILVHDLDNRIAYWNKSAERLYGWTAEEAINQRVDEFLDKEDSVRVQEARAAAWEHGEWHGELHQFTKEGVEVIVESRWTLVSDAEGRPKSMLVINTDITEKKGLETQFLRVQRMESIGTLAGGLAHDLNNVLTPILMAVRMLQEEVTTAEAQEVLKTLETSAQRGSGIVQQVLSFARGVEGERILLQIKHPLQEVINIARDTFPRSILLGIKIDTDLWPVVGDPTQLHQVFMNLCVNARDAMPNGGRLQVEAENRMIDENYAQMQPDAKAGPYVVVTISDTGAGIPPGLLSKIFEPFFTTKERGKGTGLGLSTASGIVKSHGGFLSVYSESGKGSRFRVHLPAAQETAVVKAQEPARELPTGQGEMILVADDEVAIREIIRVTLEANNYRVVTATDGTEAVSAFAERRTQVRAAIIDLMMPYMDGAATIRALQKMDPTIKCLAVSGLMETDKATEITDGKQVAFLAKPFTTEQLLCTLRDLLHPTAAISAPR